MLARERDVVVDVEVTLRLSPGPVALRMSHQRFWAGEMNSGRVKAVSVSGT
jgi:hypothetical protein